MGGSFRPTRFGIAIAAHDSASSGGVDNASAGASGLRTKRPILPGLCRSCKVLHFYAHATIVRKDCALGRRRDVPHMPHIQLCLSCSMSSFTFSACPTSTMNPTSIPLSSVPGIPAEIIGPRKCALAD